MLVIMLADQLATFSLYLLMFWLCFAGMTESCGKISMSILPHNWHKVSQ